MRTLPAIMAILVAVTVLLSCHGNADHENNEAARQLFLKSKHLTEEYIDSLEHAKDSTAINRMVENFNIKLTTVNYQFPPDTDLDLTEEENDSLIRMFKRVESTVSKKLKGFAAKEPTDSLAKDSVAIQQPSKPVTKPDVRPEVKTEGLPSHTDGN